MVLRHHHILWMILLGPIAAGLLRKMLPGQPPEVEALPLVLFVIMCGAGAVRIGAWGNLRVRKVTLAWMMLCALYTIPAFYLSWRLGIQAGILAIGAPLIGLAFLSYQQQGDAARCLGVMRIFALVMSAQVVIGLYMLRFGNAALAMIFRANLNEISIGKEVRLGQDMLAGYFTTAPVNSVATLCAFGIAASLFLYHRPMRLRLAWAAVGLALFAVAWMTARRGVFFSCSAILALVVFQEMRSRGIGALMSVLVVLPLPILAALLLANEIDSLLLGNRLVLLSGGGLDMADRFNFVFLRFLTYWIDVAPFGNFSGFASGVGKVFAVRDLLSAPAEVGAAMIVAEQGVVGLALFSAVALVAIGFMYRRISLSRQSWCFPLLITYVCIFVLFFFKESSVLFPGFIGSLVFWAIPGLVAIFTTPMRRPSPAHPAPAPRAGVYGRSVS